MSDYGEESSCGSPDDVKDPDATLDFGFNWAPFLAGDTILTSEFILPDGLTEVSSTMDGTRTSIFVSGGSAGETYRIINRVTTQAGRTTDQTIRILVQEQ